MMFVHTKQQRGFTLIELLVVIAIIGLLSSVILASLNGARKKSRDARRISDIKQLQVALELYYSEHNAYPAATSDLVPGDISSVATDPANSAAYTYLIASGGSYYCLGTTMETTPLPISTCNTSSLGASAPAGNYVVGP